MNSIDINMEQPASNQLSLLSKIMVDNAIAALLEKDYISALEYIIAVASVDKHPEVTTTLAFVVLDILDSLNLIRGALLTRTRLIRLLSKKKWHFDFNSLRQHFNSQTLKHILKLVRASRKAPLSYANDKGLSKSVKNINDSLLRYDIAECKIPSEAGSNISYIGPRPDKEIKFIAKSNTQIKFNNINTHENMILKLKKLLTSLGANIIEYDGSSDESDATRMAISFRNCRGRYRKISWRRIIITRSTWLFP